MYAKLTKDYPVEYIAGGATQNSIRVAQWMLCNPGATAFIGCIGTDAFGDQLEKSAKADGVNVQYFKTAKVETGTCAVLVNSGYRALIANPAAQPKDAANAARLRTTIILLFGEPHLPAIECLFARDWVLDGAPFRTTWVAGWWLDLPKNVDPAEYRVKEGTADGAPARHLVPKSMSKGPRRLRWSPLLLQFYGQKGQRLAVSSSSDRQDRCATLVDVRGAGYRAKVMVREDNAASGEGELHSLSPDAGLDPAMPLHYASSARIVVLHAGQLRDGKVERWLGLQSGNRHAVRIEGAVVELDLNEMNSAPQRFESVAKYEEARREYCEALVEQGQYVEDAITGNKLRIAVRPPPAPSTEQAGGGSRLCALAHFLIGCSEPHTSPATSWQDQLQYINLVTDEDATAVDPETNKRVDGVKPAGWEGLDTIAALQRKLVEPSAGREQGGVTAQPVLIRAGPGTGKVRALMMRACVLLRSCRVCEGAVWRIASRRGT